MMKAKSFPLMLFGKFLEINFVASANTQKKNTTSRDSSRKASMAESFLLIVRLVVKLPDLFHPIPSLPR